MTTRMIRLQEQKRQVKRACKKACSYRAVLDEPHTDVSGYQTVPYVS
ncbi:MAG: hypothetical protein MR868_10770 [Lachnospiraceae bacterium]|nr:hypothetical protein [Lachnospiraceae bacterium]